MLRLMRTITLTLILWTVISRFGYRGVLASVEKRMPSVNLLSIVCLVGTVTSQVAPFEPWTICGPQEMTYNVFDEAAIVTQLNWTSIGLYFNTTTEWMLQLITEIMAKNRDIRMTMTSRLEQKTLSQLSEKGFFAGDKACDERLNVIICDATCVRQTLIQVANVANSIFLRKSRWLLFTDSIMPEITSIGMDNVAAVIHTWGKSVMKTNHSVNSSVEYTGFAIDLLELLQEGLDFRVEFYEPTFETDIWHVLFKMLEKQEIDFLVTPSVRTVEREMQMDFTFPVQFVTYYVYYKQPPAKVSRGRVMVDFLSWKVIALFFSELVIVSIVLVVCGYLRPKYKQRKTQPVSGGVRFAQFGKNTFWLLGNFLKQGNVVGDMKPTSQPIRCVFATWCVVCLVLSVTFTAHLVSFLGVSKSKVLFPTLKDLLNNREYKWGTEGGENWMYSFLKGVKSSRLQELYNKMETFYATDPDVLSMEHGVHWERVDTDKYAYIQSSANLPAKYNNRCDLAHISENVVQAFSCLPMAKNSPYTDLFSEKIEQLHGTGVLQKITEKWRDRPKTCIEKRTSQSTVDLDMLQNVFYLVAAVLAFSACVLCLELAVATYGRSTRTTA